MSQVPDVVDFKPVGSNILIELVNSEELLPASVLEIVGETANKMADDFGAPQAYVLAVGPAAKPEDWGFSVGDRVAISAKMTPLPPVALSTDSPELLDVHGKPRRARGILDSPAGIKAVLVEADASANAETTEKCCGGGSCKV